MKIEGDNLGIVTGGTDATPRTSGPLGGSTKTATPGQGTDQLTLSPEAQLAQAATDAASALPDIRTDVVERMRTLLSHGQIGNDPQKIADAMIDGWLKTP